MREYKKLLELADKSLEEYNNSEFLEEMKNRIRQNAAPQPQKVCVKRRRRFYAAFTAIACAVLIVCSVFWILPKNITVEEKHYTTDNKATETIDLNTLNNELLNINLDDRDYEEIKRYYDKVYGDILYCETELVIGEFENILIVIVVNKDYEYTVDYNYDKTNIVYDFNLNYLERFIDAGGIYECKVYGQMDTGAEKVYFTYNTYTMEQSSNFVDLVQELIKKK